MKIIDAFTFFNEFDLLDIRLRHLYNHVENFVIVEADKTHQGVSKPYLLDDVWSRYEWALDKIIHVKVKLPDDPNPWVLENAQRNAIASAFGASMPNTIVMVSDCDEIPSHLIVERIASGLQSPVGFKQLACCWYVNIYDPRISWVGTVASSYEDMVKYQPQGLRLHRFELPLLDNGGCHFTYLGNAKDHAKKIEAFAHSEFNTDEYKSSFVLQANKDKLIDPFGRPDAYRGESLDMGNVNFPAYLAENKSAYAHMFRG